MISERLNSGIIIVLLLFSILSFSTSLVTGQTDNDVTPLNFDKNNQIILIDSPWTEYNFKLTIITGDIINGTLSVSIDKYTSIVTTKSGYSESSPLDSNQTYTFGNNGNVFFVAINFRSLGNNSEVNGQYRFEKGSIPFHKYLLSLQFSYPSYFSY